MMTKRVLLAIAISGLCVALCSSAETPTRKIDQFVILVHPCPYEALGKPDSDPYRALERAACQRWFDAIPALPQTAFAVQVDFSAAGASPDKLHQAFVDRLGPARVCRVPCEITSPEDAGALKNYYGKINVQITRQFADHALEYDPATCRATIWGQSFEGCAAGFGSAIAHGLGLKTPTELPYEMSAPDAPFLLDAAFVRNVSIPGSDIQAYLFKLADGRCAAFFRSCLTPQWLDFRPIVLPIRATEFQALTKQGDLVWPFGARPTIEQQAQTRYNQWRTIAWPADTPPSGPQSFTLSTVQERYIVAAQARMQELVSAIRSAAVKPGPE